MLKTSGFCRENTFKTFIFFWWIFCFPFLFCWGEIFKQGSFLFGCFVLFWTLQFSTNMWNIYIGKTWWKSRISFFSEMFTECLHLWKLQGLPLSMDTAVLSALQIPPFPTEQALKNEDTGYIDLKPRILTESIHSQSTTDSINKDGINMDHQKTMLKGWESGRESKQTCRNLHQQPSTWFWEFMGVSQQLFTTLLRCLGYWTSYVNDCHVSQTPGPSL